MRVLLYCSCAVLLKADDQRFWEWAKTCRSNVAIFFTIFHYNFTIIRKSVEFESLFRHNKFSLLLLWIVFLPRVWKMQHIYWGLSRGRSCYVRMNEQTRKGGDEMERSDCIFLFYWTRSSTSTHQKCNPVFILGFLLIVLEQKKIKKKQKINLKHNKYTDFVDIITNKQSRSKLFTLLFSVLLTYMPIVYN